MDWAAAIRWPPAWGESAASDARRWAQVGTLLNGKTFGVAVETC
jgi:hypothetical protein